MITPQILVLVEANPVLAGDIRIELERASYWVQLYDNFAKALDWVFDNHRTPPHGVVIDVPEGRLDERHNAFKFYRFVREGGVVVSRNQRFTGWGRQTHVVLLAPEDSRRDIEKHIDGFNIAPDAIQFKPFRLRTLTNQIVHLLASQEDRRNAEESPPIIRVRSLLIDQEEQRVSLEGRVLGLARMEYNLLLYLVMRSDKLLTRETLLRDVWELSEQGAIREAIRKRYVDVYISRLNQHFAGSDCQDLIETVYGEGYRLCTHTSPPPARAEPPILDPTEPELGLPFDARPLAYLVLVDGAGNEAKVRPQLPLKGAPASKDEPITFHIGRDPESCIGVIDDRRISRRHAIITLEGLHFFIADNHSAGGTYLRRPEEANEMAPRRLSPGQKVLLRDGDEIHFNALIYRFETTPHKTESNLEMNP